MPSEPAERSYTEAVEAQVNHILRSEAFHSAEGLRRLLKFLTEKTLSGEADHLKEYSIGVDAFGKSPATYDPKRDSHVRIQVGRLRKKLVEYYNKEGRSDSLIIEVPKGRFALAWHSQAGAQLVSAESPIAITPEIVSHGRPTGGTPILTAVLTLAMLAVVSYLSIELNEERKMSALIRADWTPAVEELWSPFLSTRPLLISLSAPMFLAIPGIGFFRDRTVNSEVEANTSSEIAALRRTLRVPNVKPEYPWTSLEEAKAVFALTKLLATRKADISVVGTSDLAWDQLSENNVLFVGAPKLFNQQLSSMPIKRHFMFDRDGLHNLYPESGQEVLFQNRLSRDGTGTAYALVSHTPGPLGTGDIEGFLSLVSAARTAAVECFTQPVTARMIVRKLKGRSGIVPRYYELVLRIRLEHQLPMESSYVMHRDLGSEE